MSAQVSVRRAAFLLTQLRLRRQLNQFGASFARLRARQADKKAAARTSPARALLTALVTLAMLVSFANLARQSMINMENVLGSQTVRSTGSPGPRDRGASVRMPVNFVKDGYKGYLEDRRPNSAADPYLVAGRILKTVQTVPTS